MKILDFIESNWPHYVYGINKSQNAISYTKWDKSAYTYQRDICIFELSGKLAECEVCRQMDMFQRLKTFPSRDTYYYCNNNKKLKTKNITNFTYPSKNRNSSEASGDAVW